MSDEAAQSLARILAHHGRDVANDARLCENLLRDYCPQACGDINVLVAAIRAGVVEKLPASGAGDAMLALKVRQLVQTLQRDMGLAPDRADWAVRAWAAALGLVLPPETEPAARARSEAAPIMNVHFDQEQAPSHATGFANVPQAAVGPSSPVAGSRPVTKSSSGFRQPLRIIALVGLIIGGIVYFQSQRNDPDRGTRSPVSTPPIVTPHPTPAPASVSPLSTGSPKPPADAKRYSIAPLPASALDQLNAMIAAARRGDDAALARAQDALRAMRPPSRGGNQEARRLNDLGIAADRGNDINASVEYFYQAFAIDPTDVEIANNLGGAFYRALRFDLAERAALRALALAPDRTNAWVLVGHGRAMENDINAAVGCYRNALRFSRNPQRTLQSIEDRVNERVEPGMKQALAVLKAGL